MKRENLPGYLAEAKALRGRYADRIALFVGLEVDYVPGVSAPRSSEIASLGLDYVIGSVHYVNPPASGPGWTVDGSAKELDAGVREDFGGDLEAAVAAYYRRIAEMVRLSPPDIIGHLDLVKKNNARECRFSESAPWYRRAVAEALDAVSESCCVLEVNTGGLNRGTVDEIYPSPWILGECKERHIRIVVSADAHRPEHVDGYFDRAFGLIRAAGYLSRLLLTPEGWVEREL